MKYKKIITSLTAFVVATAGIAGTGMLKGTEVSAMAMFVNKMTVSSNQSIITVPLGTEVTADYILANAGIGVELEIGDIHDWPEDELYGQTTYRNVATDEYSIALPETFVNGENTLEFSYTGNTYSGVKVPEKENLIINLDYKTGDITGDSQTNISDMIILSKYIINAPSVPAVVDAQATKLGSEETIDSNATTFNMQQGDVNADGQINVFDLIIMARHILNN